MLTQIGDNALHINLRNIEAIKSQGVKEEKGF